MQLSFLRLLATGATWCSLAAALPTASTTCAQNQGVACDQPTTQGLPSNAGMQFKYAALAIGVQNYTCASTTSAPVAAGALATLFDATQLFSSKYGQLAIDNASMVYLRAYEAQKCTKFGTKDVTQDACEQKANLLRLPVIGHHYFANVNGKGVPTFDVTVFNNLLSAKKVAGTPAPQGSYAGSNRAGAVDWLLLNDDGTGKSHGLSDVFRVETAGGTPLSNACSKGDSVVGIKYAAQYWLYA